MNSPDRAVGTQAGIVLNTLRLASHHWSQTAIFDQPHDISPYVVRMIGKLFDERIRQATHSNRDILLIQRFASWKCSAASFSNSG